MPARHCRPALGECSIVNSARRSVRKDEAKRELGAKNLGIVVLAQAVHRQPIRGSVCCVKTNRSTAPISHMAVFKMDTKGRTSMVGISVKNEIGGQVESKQIPSLV
jgi:hypothetical protein